MNYAVPTGAWPEEEYAVQGMKTRARNLRAFINPD